MKDQFIKTIYLLILSHQLYAQEIQQPPLLQVGQLAPALHVYEWVKSNGDAHIAPGQFYLVEFGATWCKPCAEAIPHLSSIQEEFKGEVRVLSIFVMEHSRGHVVDGKPDYVRRVEEYVGKKKDLIGYDVGVDDVSNATLRNWVQATGSTGVPMIFILGRDKKIAWIGNDIDKARAHLSTLIKNAKAGTVETLLKVPALGAGFDNKRLLYLNGNGGSESPFLVRSILTHFTGGLEAANPQYVDSYLWTNDPAYEYLKGRIQVVGAPMHILYNLAYGDTMDNQVYTRSIRTLAYPDTVKSPHFKSAYGKVWHHPLLEVSDLSFFQFNRSEAKNKYNYSLKIEGTNITAQDLQARMRADLSSAFPFQVTVETRQMPCWTLTIGDVKKVNAMQSKGKKFEVIDHDDPFIFRNATTRDVIWMLGSNYGYGVYDYGKVKFEDQAPFVDETGLAYPIDFVYNRNWSFDEFRNYLVSNGFNLIKKLRPMKVVVIRDRSS